MPHSSVKEKLLMPVIVILIGIVCLWGLVKIVRGKRRSTEFDTPSAPALSEEKEFNEWVGRNTIASGNLSPEDLAELRKKFDQERE
jgi:hypothetical protein